MTEENKPYSQKWFYEVYSVNEIKDWREINVYKNIKLQELVVVLNKYNFTELEKVTLS